MALFEWRIVCVTICILSYAVSGKGAEPNGYLKVNQQQFHDSAKKAVYQFYNGEHLVCSCHGAAGNDIRIRHLKDGKIIKETETASNEAVSIQLQLHASSNKTSIRCYIEDVPTSERKIINLELIVGNKKMPTFWIIVFAVVGFLVLVGAGTWIWICFRNRRKKYPSHMVTFADRNSIENLDPRATQQIVTSANTSEPNDAPVQQSEPNNGPVQQSEPNNAPVQQSEPNNAPVQQSEPNNASMPQNEPTQVSVQIEPTHCS